MPTDEVHPAPSGGSQLAGQLYLGCAIWAYPGWNGNFYPRGTKPNETLRLFAERMNAVEGNTTFYAVPPVETVERWSTEMPSSFRFCPKLPRELSHQGELMPSLPGVHAFLDRLEPLHDRLGMVFVQLPSSYGPDRGRDLVDFLAAWPNDRVHLGIELRHPEWFSDRVRPRLDRALRAGNTTNVILDTRPIFEGPDNPQAHSKRKKPNLPVRPEATSSRCMVRYIGHPTPARNFVPLKRWAKRTARWLREGRDVQFFCHCPEEEVSPQLARHFQTELEALVPEVSPLPWNSLPSHTEQLELY